VGWGGVGWGVGWGGVGVRVCKGACGTHVGDGVPTRAERPAARRGKGRQLAQCLTRPWPAYGLVSGVLVAQPG
jgi:hypothetical protein